MAKKDESVYRKQDVVWRWFTPLVNQNVHISIALINIEVASTNIYVENGKWLKWLKTTKIENIKSTRICFLLVSIHVEYPLRDMLTLNARNRRLDDILQDISIGLFIDKMAIYLHTNYYSQDINFCNFCFSGINSGLGTVNIKECNRNLGILIKMRGESFPNILLFAGYGFL